MKVLVGLPAIKAGGNGGLCSGSLCHAGRSLVPWDRAHAESWWKPEDESLARQSGVYGSYAKSKAPAEVHSADGLTVILGGGDNCRGRDGLAGDNGDTGETDLKRRL